MCDYAQAVGVVGICKSITEGNSVVLVPCAAEGCTSGRILHHMCQGEYESKGPWNLLPPDHHDFKPLACLGLGKMCMTCVHERTDSCTDSECGCPEHVARGALAAVYKAKNELKLKGKRRAGAANSDVPAAGRRRAN